MPGVWKEGWLADTTSWWFCTDYGQRCREKKRHKLVSTIWLNSIVDCKTVNTHTHTLTHTHTHTLTHTHTHTHTRSILIFTRMELNQPHYSPCPIHYSVAIRHLALPPSKPTPSCQVPIYTLLSLLGHSYADRFLSDQHPPTPPLPSAPPHPSHQQHAALPTLAHPLGKFTRFLKSVTHLKLKNNYWREREPKRTHRSYVSLASLCIALPARPHRPKGICIIINYIIIWPGWRSNNSWPCTSQECA